MNSTMNSKETSALNTNNVTNLDDARKARAVKQAQVEQAAAASGDTNEADNPHGNRRFDAEKVARIKAAIAAGEYKINPSRIADKFIEHDRNQ